MQFFFYHAVDLQMNAFKFMIFFLVLFFFKFFFLFSCGYATDHLILFKTYFTAWFTGSCLQSHLLAILTDSKFLSFFVFILNSHHCLIDDDDDFDDDNDGDDDDDLVYSQQIHNKKLNSRFVSLACCFFWFAILRAISRLFQTDFSSHH